MSDRRPVVIADDAFRFTLEVERTDVEAADGLWVADDGTIIRFLDWQRDNDIYPFGGGASGPGFWTGTFPAAAKPLILTWCVREGLFDWEDVDFTD